MARRPGSAPFRRELLRDPLACAVAVQGCDARGTELRQCPVTWGSGAVTSGDSWRGMSVDGLQIGQLAHVASLPDVGGNDERPPPKAGGGRSGPRWSVVVATVPACA
jgi:hypothetical protein